MKIGDFVTLNKKSYWYNKGYRFIGKVTNIEEGVDSENHGCIEIQIIETKNYLSVGELEHFSHYNWQNHLEIIHPKCEYTNCRDLCTCIINKPVSGQCLCDASHNLKYR